MRPYELMTILAPDVPEDELTPTLDAIAGYITTAGGEIVHVSRESPWGRRRLAYSIRYAGRDVRDGFYTLWYFDAEPTAIADIERELRLNDRIMRYLTIVLEKQFELIIVEPTDEETAGEAPDGEAPEGEASESTPEGEASENTPAEAAAESDESEPAVDDAPAAEESAVESAETGAEADVAGEADVPEAEAEAIDGDVETEPEAASKE